MFIGRFATLVAACTLMLGLIRADEPKKDAWIRIVTDLVSPEASKKGIEAQGNAGVPADFELNLDLKKLGMEGKFSAKQIKEKYGPPTKVDKYATREDGKVVNYEKWLYPPIALTFPAGGDQATLLSATKKLWGGEGILENAKAAEKPK